MTPDTALWIILTITIVYAGLGAVLAVTFRAEMRRAVETNRRNGLLGVGVLVWILSGIATGLWVYYGWQVGEPLLYVIPLVSWTVGVIVRGFLKLAS